MGSGSPPGRERKSTVSDYRGHGNDTGINAKKSVLFGKFEIASGKFTEISWAMPARRGATVNRPIVGLGKDGNPWVVYRYFNRELWRVAATGYRLDSRPGVRGGGSRTAATDKTGLPFSCLPMAKATSAFAGHPTSDPTRPPDRQRLSGRLALFGIPPAAIPEKPTKASDKQELRTRTKPRTASLRPP